MRGEMEEMKDSGEKDVGGWSSGGGDRGSGLRVIRSLDGTSVIFPVEDDIKREGNTIIHHGSASFRNCFIGGVMTSV